MTTTTGLDLNKYNAIQPQSEDFNLFVINLLKDGDSYSLHLLCHRDLVQCLNHQLTFGYYKAQILQGLLYPYHQIQLG
jgi:hypothetical protein